AAVGDTAHELGISLRRILDEPDQGARGPGVVGEPLGPVPDEGGQAQLPAERNRLSRQVDDASSIHRRASRTVVYQGYDAVPQVGDAAWEGPSRDVDPGAAGRGFAHRVEDGLGTDAVLERGRRRHAGANSFEEEPDQRRDGGLADDVA